MQISRRHMLVGTLAYGSAVSANTVGAATADTLPESHRAGSVPNPAPTRLAQPGAGPANFRYCLNTSTINREKVPLAEQVRIAADAKYDGIEIWMPDVNRFLADGGKLADIRKACEDSQLKIESAIGFGRWIVNNDSERAKGLEQCRRDMSNLRELGGKLIAAPPAGATGSDYSLDLDAAAERYATLLELGAQLDVTPQLELWGFSKNLSKLSELLYVAASAQHPSACLLLDVYHLYKGGFQFDNLSLIPGAAVGGLHMNDYPESPDRDSIGDQHRVYPGDGIAPIGELLHALAQSGFAGPLSLELFNRTYWQQEPSVIAVTGLRKMQAVVASVFEAAK